MLRTTVLKPKSLRLIQFQRRWKTTDFSHIKTIEDLSELPDLKDVPPTLITKILNEKTNELNIQNELQLLKNIQREERQLLDEGNPLKRYFRAGWIFLFLASSVYLTMHSVWWRLAYIEREEKLEAETKLLEEKMEELRKQQERSWYSKLFKWY